MAKNKQKLRLTSEWSESRFQQLLDKIEEKSSVNPEGRMSWSDWSIDIYFSVAIEAFQLLHGIPKREFSNAIRRAIIDSRTRGELSFRNVVRSAEEKIRQFTSKPHVQFAILMEIDLDLPVTSSSKRFKFDDVTLEVSRHIPKYMLGDHLKDASRSPYGDAPSKRYCAVIARCRARTEFEAASKAFDASAVFFGLANLMTKSWNIFGGEQKPVSLFMEGPYQYIFRNRVLVSNQWYNPDFREEYWSSLISEGNKFLKVVNSLRTALEKLEKHPLRSALIPTLHMISNGMESHKLDDRTLYYWTAIERLFSRDHEKVPYDKIIRRASFLERDRSEARIFLNHLASLRNERVHHGKSANHHHQVLEYTTDLVSRFIFYLIFHGDDFADHGEFLEMSDLPADRDALTRRQVAIERRLNFIETKRHKREA